MRAVLGAVASLLLLVPAVGFAQPAQPRPCPIEMATDGIAIENIQRQGTIAQSSTPLLHELQAINNKATDPNKPLGEQLSPSDAARFAEISERIKQVRLTQYVESSRARDAGMIQKMFNAAWNDYSDHPEKIDNKDWSIKLLMLMRQLPVNFEWHAQTEGKDCTIDGALATQEDAAIRRGSPNQALMQSISQQAAAIWVRNGITGDTPKDISKLPPDDQRAMQALINQIGPMMKDLKLSSDIAHIRAWWAICDLEYRDRKEDLLNYADVNHIGDTIKAQLATMSDTQQTFAKLWDTTDNTVPNEEARMAAPIAEIVRKDQERQAASKRSQARH